MALEQEYQTYLSHLEQLQRLHMGEWVLIFGNDVIATFKDYGEAREEGYRRFGLKPFMVNEIYDVAERMRSERPINLSPLIVRAA